MKIHGVVAEFNPFHNGHKYLLEECRKKGASHVVVVMSSNFVQRGEPAIMDKWSRAKCALLNGADLVVELPAVWSLSSAENFARGSIEILNGLGCVDELNFGSENADLDSLQKIAKTDVNEKTQEYIKKHLSTFVSYPTARQKAISEICGEDIAKILANPNDILGVEYIKAINAIKSTIKPNAIKRTGPKHDAKEEISEFLSATEIRKELIGCDYKGFDFVPKSVENVIEESMHMGRAPVDINKLETSILSKLRVMDVSEIKCAPDVSEGLENRIYSCIKSATSLKQLYDEIKTKRYTYSRIKRIIMSLYLGIKSTDVKKVPPYIRVLGFNNRGREILKIAKDTAIIPVITKSAHIRDLDDNYAQRIFNIECSSTDMFTLAMPNPLPCGMEMTENVIII